MRPCVWIPRICEKPCTGACNPSVLTERQEAETDLQKLLGQIAHGTQWGSARDLVSDEVEVRKGS